MPISRAVPESSIESLASSGKPLLVDVDAMVASAQALEPLPASVARLAALVADEDVDLREIVEVISLDQALTGNLLRRANSAASAGRNPIKTVHEAVVRLGSGTVLALAMSSSVAKRMSKSLPEYGLSEGDLWRHSVHALLAAETIRGSSRSPIPPEVSTAALLHDIGKLVLARFLGTGVLEYVRAASESDHLTQLDAEVAVLQVHHGELGGLVAQHWNLPESIVKAISYHHTPAEAELPICYAVHLANIVAHDLVDAHDERDDSARDESLRELGIPVDKWDTICNTVDARYRDLADRYV